MSRRGHNRMPAGREAFSTPMVMQDQPASVPFSRLRSGRWLVNALIVVFLFTVSYAINESNIVATERHPDETRWLNRAYYIEDFADPYGKTWQDYYLTRGQPPGGSYLIGLGLLVQGQPLDSNGVWDFHYGDDWNENTGAVPDRDVLLAGRRTNAVVGALVVVVTFIAANMLTNRIGGLFAGLFLAYHPLHIKLSTQALSDELLALTLAVTFVASFKFARQPSFGWALLMGVSLGIGGATKLAPLALSFVLAGFGVIWLLWRHRRFGREALRWPASRQGIFLLLQPVISGFIFVAMYPYLWVAPIRRSLELLDFRRTEMASQARIWPWAQVDNPKDAFMRYGEQLHDAASSTRHFQQWILDQLGYSVRNPVSFDFIIVAIGAILLLRIVLERGLWSPHAMMALVMAAEVGAVTVGLGVDFYRYYLPVLLVNSILVGVAFGMGSESIRDLYSRKWVAASSPESTAAAASWKSQEIGPERAS